MTNAILLAADILALAWLGHVVVVAVFGRNDKLYSTRQREKIRTRPWWSHW